jgi:hypothetical protein
MRNIGSLILLIALFTGCIFQPDVYHSGFMYWYGPTPLQTDWCGLLIGTVSYVNRDSTKEDYHAYSGEIKIKEVLFTKPIKGAKSFSAKKLQCNGGFNRLSVGDKVLVILIEYEKGYNIPDYKETNCSLGYKLDTFNDPIVSAAKAFAQSNHVEKDYYRIWSQYDAEGLRYRIERQNTEPTNSADPKGRTAD